MKLVLFKHSFSLHNSQLTIVLVKSMVEITQSQTFLGLIFLVQVSLGNEKKFCKQAKVQPVY